MGNDGGSMTAKAISKKIKAKGLGRLRWYCQMCEKQCRDENGFKCHTQSASHQRQLELFSEETEQNLSRFSETFLKEFLAVLRQRYGSNLVGANAIYQEYIKDRHHLHMNATRWTTLSEFVKELGREGYCQVVEKEDGFWIAFIDRSLSEKDKMARDMDAQRMRDDRNADLQLQRQIRAAMSHTTHRPVSPPEDLLRGKETRPVSMELKHRSRFSTSIAAGNENALKEMGNPLLQSGKSESLNNSSQASKRKTSRWDNSSKMSALEEIMLTEKKKNEQNDGGAAKAEQTDGSVGKETQGECPGGTTNEAWLRKGIVVKVINKEVGDGAYYKKKGSVISVLEEYGARVQLSDCGVTLELDQDDLETTIPKPGGAVLILRGPNRGAKAFVESINVESFCVDVTLAESGQLMPGLEYEAVSRAVP